MDGSFIAPLLHQHIWHHAHRYTHNLPFTAALPSLCGIPFKTTHAHENKKILFLSLQHVPFPRIFLGCLTLGITSAPLRPLSTKLFVFRRGETCWLSGCMHADVHETLSARAGVCLGPRRWLIMAHYCSPGSVLFSVDWLFCGLVHIFPSAASHCTVTIFDLVINTAWCLDRCRTSTFFGSYCWLQIRWNLLNTFVEGFIKHYESHGNS